MQITGFPRIHVGLTDLGFASQRRFGGVGFAIDYPITVMEFNGSSEFALTGLDGLDLPARAELQRIFVRLQDLARAKPFCAHLSAHAPQHCGFGSKTTLVLSLIAGANEFLKLGLSREQMQLMSGRGGTSGIGIHTFFAGGVICDGGHPSHLGAQLLPSSARSKPLLAPPVLSWMGFPQQWKVVLLLGKDRSLSGAEEAEFFRRNAPIERQDALETIAIIHHGVLPAFATADRPALARALSDLHSHGFKLRELLRCDSVTQDCYRHLSALGCAVGLSSMGPLLYVLINRDDGDELDRVNKVAAIAGATVYAEIGGRNIGYELAELSR
ncbi:sugar kinase [Bradyrhizobium sp. WYCCWR 13022]|uniref:beta-ribofuranosylaminobenzene 5'-phosphate synthase family protein n=1 Tax=unclassified Bradyrhizobium TaxID=2631580 RepID=UPI00263AF929|nr:beta-ribofuranosylaminobenzene 5'-phosphate synthase family protein [Bradyrhizobium sp. WYCCWR 13022]MDN4984657.1 sugar kinase [Bradyrhizobium sp. WYCCWR 13022]